MHHFISKIRSGKEINENEIKKQTTKHLSKSPCWLDSFKSLKGLDVLVLW